MTRRFRRHYPDQDPPKATPQRHLVIFPDDFEETPRIGIMVNNKRGDTARSLSLSLDDAEEMAQAVLHMVAEFRAAQPTPEQEGNQQ